MQGEVPTTQQIVKEFEKRDKAVKASVESERQQKQAEREKREETRRQRVMRSVSAGGEEAKMDTSAEALIKPKKTVESYEHAFSQKTQFFSDYNPDMIEEALCEYLKNQIKVDPKVNKQKYKVKFTLASKDQGDQTHETEICVRILKVNDSQVCVEFSKLSGNQIRFHDHFRELKDNVLNFANDSTYEVAA